MLSGIGPAAHLRELGIEVDADLPVGQNLHDHLFVPMTFVSKKARASRHPDALRSRAVLKELRKPRQHAGSAAPCSRSVGFVRTSFAKDVPDMQIHTLPWSYPSPNQDEDKLHMVDRRAAMTVFPTLIYPKSRGELRLASTDPLASPLIDPGYLSDPADTRLPGRGHAA